MEGTAVIGLLLDTHTWIWALERPERLGAKARKQIEDTGNDLYLSPISIWEAHHLSQRRRLRHKGTFQEWLDAAFQSLPLQEAPFNFAVAREATQIQLPQPDIGDLLLAATAIAFGHTLVTTGAQLLAHPAIKTLRAD